MTTSNQPSLDSVLQSYAELLEGARRMADLCERLLGHATGESLTADEVRDVRRELETMREALEQLDAMLVLWKQGHRLM